ncbi:UNVERIFIED_CONTAM: DnaJsubfamily C member 28 [Sesamum radiatum]|uniref:DnaJsubfamily C member 28 n=1 Tax=Sesamum radiatum TaxID=300843 RepID=A0AAW2LAN2_SESRA
MGADTLFKIAASVLVLSSVCVAAGDAKDAVFKVGGRVLCQDCAEGWNEWVNGANPIKGCKVSVTCLDDRNRVVHYASDLTDDAGNFEVTCNKFITGLRFYYGWTKVGQILSFFSAVGSKSGTSGESIFVRGRWASSSSSSSDPSSPKPNKKVTHDRLASVIDAVNDRKLPPELRGQRNNVSGYGCIKVRFWACFSLVAAYTGVLLAYDMSVLDLAQHKLISGVSEADIINVVEQRVWHAMEEGQFENLPGKGKPLDLSSNPHADPAEDTLYRILNKNGCAPEWVELNKEIRNSIAGWRLALRKAWMYKGGRDDSKWLELSEVLKLQLRDLNNKVLHYNLIVPFGRQMFGFKWEREIDRLNDEIQMDK